MRVVRSSGAITDKDAADRETFPADRVDDRTAVVRAQRGDPGDAGAISG
jgi:hypothetical protein